MGKAYEKGIRRAQEVVASVGAPHERTEPRTRREIESFLRGFGMSTAATRRIVDEWMADRARIRAAAQAECCESEYGHPY